MQMCELNKLILEARTALYGDDHSEPVAEICAQLTQEFFRDDMLRLLIICLPKLDSGVRNLWNFQGSTPPPLSLSLNKSQQNLSWRARGRTKCFQPWKKWGGREAVLQISILIPSFSFLTVACISFESALLLCMSYSFSC